ncbi:MAG: hypothetical protein EZS28_032168, partial [Streblomastix strix]
MSVPVTFPVDPDDSAQLQHRILRIKKNAQKSGETCTMVVMITFFIIGILLMVFLDIIYGSMFLGVGFILLITLCCRDHEQMMEKEIVLDGNRGTCVYTSKPVSFACICKGTTQKKFSLNEIVGVAEVTLQRTVIAQRRNGGMRQRER